MNRASYKVLLLCMQLLEEKDPRVLEEHLSFVKHNLVVTFKVHDSLNAASD